MRKSIFILSGILLVLIPSKWGYAESGRFAVGGKVGTLGLGGEITAGITSNINTRVGINGFSYDYSGTEGDVEYDIDLKLFSASLLLDWHPFGGGFRISGGLLINQNELDTQARPMTSYTIGNTTYTPAQVGTLRGSIDFNDMAPYAGIGWGNAVGKDKKWGVTFDIGVVFQGSPKVSLTADGLLASDPTFQANLKREEDELQDALDEFEYYPAIAIGITYKF